MRNKQEKGSVDNAFMKLGYEKEEQNSSLFRKVAHGSPGPLTPFLTLCRVMALALSPSCRCQVENETQLALALVETVCLPIHPSLLS